MISGQDKDPLEYSHKDHKQFTATCDPGKKILKNIYIYLYCIDQILFEWIDIRLKK